MSDTPEKLTISLHVEIDVAMTRAEFWPDKDGPEKPTLADVIKVIKECGGPRRILDEWDLLDGAHMDVSLATGDERSGHAVVDWLGNELGQRRSSGPTSKE